MQCRNLCQITYNRSLLLLRADFLARLRILLLMLILIVSRVYCLLDEFKQLAVFGDSLSFIHQSDAIREEFHPRSDGRYCPTNWLVEFLPIEYFAAVPGILLLMFFAPWNTKDSEVEEN
jgi:hypothetical protein